MAGKEEERIKILGNLVKSVKPGGTVLLIEPNPLNPFYYPFYWFSREVSWEVERHFIKSAEGNLRKILKNLGLEKIQVNYVGFLPLRLIEVFPPIKFINMLFNKIPLVNKFSSFIYIKGFLPPEDHKKGQEGNIKVAQRKKPLIPKTAKVCI